MMLCGSSIMLLPRECENEKNSGAGRMEINRIVERTVFEPEDIQVIVSAYECAKDKLGIIGRDSGDANLLAKTVMRIAAEGPGDSEQICERAISTIRRVELHG